LASERRQARRAAQGFVLALTLWILAAIAVAVGLATLWALDAVRNATAEHARVEGQLAMAGTRDTLLYLGATRQRTLAGLATSTLADDERALRSFDDLGGMRSDPVGGELRLDGRPYAGLDGTSFSIQDDAGLFVLSSPDPTTLERFLVWAGVPRDEVGTLRDAFLDYTDADDLRRLNGAEAKEYERESRPPPPNRRLLMPVETDRILGWDKLPQSVREHLPDLTTTVYAGGANLNTMPAALLPAWIAGCPENCKRLVARRDLQPFRFASEVELFLGVRLPGDPASDYRFMPDETLRFTLWSRSGPAWRIHVRFTPLADQVGPWSILAVHPISRPGNDAPAQPTGSDLFADVAAGRP
jgi:hypothetical protein